MESQHDQDNQERTLLVSSHDDADIDLPSQTRSSPKVRYMTGLVLLGIMLFAAVASKAGSTYLYGNLKDTVQLDDESPASKFYVVKQTFKSDDDVNAFWDAWNHMPEEVSKQFVKDGYHIPICAMLAKKGPFFHVLEQKAGSSDDAQNYFDQWVEDNLGVKMLNAITPLAFPPVTPFFGADEDDSSRRLSARKLDVGFYLVEMTSDKDDAEEYAENFDKAGGWKKWNQDAEKAKCHDHMCIAVEGGGLSYELMEAKPGVTSEDIDEYFNTWIGQNLHVNVGVKVWPIPKDLNGGGAAGIGVKQYFRV